MIAPQIARAHEPVVDNDAGGTRAATGPASAPGVGHVTGAAEADAKDRAQAASQER